MQRIRFIVHPSASGMKELLHLERQFWTGDADFYRKHLARDAVMAFPGMGISERDAIISGIEGATRWISIEISDERVMELPGGAAVLAYSALARRGGAEPYTAVVSSVYVREDGAWKLAFHHQSPVQTPLLTVPTE